jgi:hypothetical protein
MRWHAGSASSGVAMQQGCLRVGLVAYEHSHRKDQTYQKHRLQKHCGQKRVGGMPLCSKDQPYAVLACGPQHAFCAAVVM